MKSLSIAIALSLLLSGCGDKTPDADKAPQVVSTSVSGVLDAATVYDVTLGGTTYKTEHAQASYEGENYNISSEKRAWPLPYSSKMIRLRMLC